MMDSGLFADPMSAYGRWCRLLEIVALKMDETDRCHAEYSIKKWCSFLHLKQNKLSLFLELTQNKLRTKVTRSDNVIRIEIPNLLKKRDKHTHDLSVKRKRLISKIKREDKDKEKIEKKENVSLSGNAPPKFSATEKNVTTRPRQKSKPKVPPPEKFLITDDLKAWAKKIGVTANLENETAQFLDYHKARGSKFVSWESAWRTWMRNTKKWGATTEAATPENDYGLTVN